MKSHKITKVATEQILSPHCTALQPIRFSYSLGGGGRAGTQILHLTSADPVHFQP